MRKGLLLLLVLGGFGFAAPASGAASPAPRESPLPSNTHE